MSLPFVSSQQESTTECLYVALETLADVLRCLNVIINIRTSFTSSPTHSPTPTIINNEQSCGHAFPRFAHSQDEMGAAAITEALEAANMPTDVPTGLFVGECKGGGVGRTY